MLADDNTCGRAFGRICAERGLDPNAIPTTALLVLGTLDRCVMTLGLPLAAEPGLMKWYAAGLAAYAEATEIHAEETFEKLAELEFDELQFDDEGWPL